MNKPEEIFLKLLFSAVNGLPVDQSLLEEGDPADQEALWRSLAQYGRSHSVLPLIYDKVGKTPAFLSLPSGVSSVIRRESVAITALQCRKSRKLMHLLEEIRKSEIECLLIKGMICRALYPSPDLRFSSDEDLVIRRPDLERLLALMKEFGMQIAPYEQNDNVVKVGDATGFMLEIHMLPLFGVENHSFRIINRFLQDVFLRKTVVMVDQRPIDTMDPTDHLIFLFAHCLEHLVHAGVSIRQLCDIMLFVRAYDDQLDYCRLKYCLDQSGLLPFVCAITDIIVKLLCPEDGMPQGYLDVFEGVTVDSSPLLSDILQAGVYGKSTMSRVHKESRKGRSHSVSETLNIGSERIKLLGMYGITEQTDKKGKKSRKSGQTPNLSPENHCRVVETAAYLETLCDLIREGQQVSLQISGSSMIPFLAGNRDRVLLSAADGKLKKGDVCLYRRINGQFVLHRLYRVKDGKYYFLGDAQCEIEGPLAKEQICAKVIAAVRKDKKITPKDGIWKFYEKLWIRVRHLRKPAIRLVSLIKK